ncbi:MAG: sodium/proline symporter [Candidatus Eisenbacteria bacterium]
MNGAFDGSLLLGFGLYLLLMLVVGAVTVKYMKGLDDFVLGGRRLGPWVTAVSERASGESAWFLLGLPGAAYAAGFREFWSVIGIGFGIFASWNLLARGLRRMSEETGALTIPDFLARRFGGSDQSLRTIATVILLVFYTSYIGAQLVGSGQILEATFGIDRTIGMAIGAFVVVLYTMLGGFLAVAWTDLFQGLLMAAVALILPILGIAQLGGWDAFVAQLVASAPPPEPGATSPFLAMDAGQTGRAFVFGVMIGNLSWGLGYFGQPHLLTRYMAIRSVKDLRLGTLIAMSWVLIAYWGAVFIGFVGRGVLGPELAEAEQVMPLLTKALVPSWLAGIFISGAVAAMMSTADSQIMVASSSLIEDVYVNLVRRGRPTESPARLVLLARISAFAITALALFLAFVSRDLIYDMVAYAWAGLGASFGPTLILAIWWKRLTRGGAIGGMVMGTVATIVWKNVPGLQELLDIKVASFLLALGAAVLLSLLRIGDPILTRPKERTVR